MDELKDRLKEAIAYTAGGGMSDEEYLRENAELQALIKKAEAEAPEKPRDVQPLRELMEMDIKALYETFTEEERQRFWQRIIKEIKIEKKKVKKVIFFLNKSME